MSNNLVFNSGVPTEPDVRKLMDAFGAMQEGAVISYADISAIIGSPSKSFRFATVVNAWRKRLYREQNVVLCAVAGVGLKVADPDLRVNLAGAKYKSGIRHIRRAGDVSASTDRARLSPEAAKAADHLNRVASSVMLAAATEARKLNYKEPKKVAGA